MKETPPPRTNRHLRTAFEKHVAHPAVALPAESRAAKKDIRAKPVSWPCQTKSLKPSITNHNPASAAASLSPNLTRAFPLKNARYGKFRKSNPLLSNTSSIKQPALVDIKTALMYPNGCTQAQGKTSRRLSLT